VKHDLFGTLEIAPNFRFEGLISDLPRLGRKTMG